MFFGVPSTDLIVQRIAKMKPTLFTKLDIRQAVSSFRIIFFDIQFRQSVIDRKGERNSRIDHDSHCSTQVSNLEDKPAKKVLYNHQVAEFSSAKDYSSVTNAGIEQIKITIFFIVIVTIHSDSSPAVFNAAMNKVLAPGDGFTWQRDHLIQYFDDLLIVSSDISDEYKKLYPNMTHEQFHLHIVKSVLLRLNDWGLRISPEKCLFLSKECEFLVRKTLIKHCSRCSSTCSNASLNIINCYPRAVVSTNMV